ncbi:hypothetical protein DC20_07235 [Rufibacter tibetensis]|uniref:Uncharacterized protein n=1 Tax=Rufibacter tibetensis TaxID=512763 RepID=A0A0P0CNP1_9BACT|nr:hypothetical protein DC20_07235 [Rufibacter tibetensis]
MGKAEVKRGKEILPKGKTLDDTSKNLESDPLKQTAAIILFPEKLTQIEIKRSLPFFKKDFGSFFNLKSA